MEHYFFKESSIDTLVFMPLTEIRDTRETTRLQLSELLLIEFSTENEKCISNAVLFTSPLGKFKIGEALSLHYNAKKPQKFIVNSTNHSHFNFPIFVSSIIVIALIIMLLFLLKLFFA